MLLALTYFLDVITLIIQH